MIFSNPTKIRAAWRDTLQRAGSSVVLNASLARTELMKAYPSPTEADSTDVENLVAALQAGAYQIVESAGFRDTATVELARRLRLSATQSSELVAALAPDRMRDTDPSPAPGGAGSPARRRRRLLGVPLRTLAVALPVMALLAVGGVLAMKKNESWNDEAQRLRTEIGRLTTRESVLRKKETALVGAEARVAELETQLGKPGTVDDPGTGMTGELAKAKAEVEQLKRDLEDAKAQIPEVTLPVPPEVISSPAPLTVRETAYQIELKANGDCNGANGCSSVQHGTFDVSVTNTGRGKMRIQIGSVVNADLELTIGGAWVGIGDLQQSFGAVCNGAGMTGPVKVVAFNKGFSADPDRKVIEVSSLLVLIVEEVPSCGLARFSYSGDVTERPR